MGENVMTDEPKVIDWFEEGRKQFVSSKINPEKPPKNYPTQDIHTAKDEADYIAGFNSAEKAWQRGEGFSGMASYVEEIDEGKRAEKANDKIDK
jgi:hypothetical protein